MSGASRARLRRVGPIAAMVAVGQQVFVAPGEIGDEQLDELRDLGYRDEQIADVVGLVARNVMTGAFNLVAGIHPAVETESAA
jgi:alkylhydroperoxidase family enzyme